jgi:hypothetical protein
VVAVGAGERKAQPVPEHRRGAASQCMDSTNDLRRLKLKTQGAEEREISTGKPLSQLIDYLLIIL